MTEQAICQALRCLELIGNAIRSHNRPAAFRLELLELRLEINALDQLVSQSIEFAQKR